MTTKPADEYDFDAATPALRSDKAAPTKPAGVVQRTPPRGRMQANCKALLMSDAEAADLDNGRRW